MCILIACGSQNYSEALKVMGYKLKKVKIRKVSSPAAQVTVTWCDSFLSKLKGLMFSKSLKTDSGLIFAEKKESRINTSIHMLFMKYDLTILWLDKHRVVVDKVRAKRWVPYYCPKRPAQFVLELHPSKFSEYSIGDKLVFDTQS